VNGSGFPGAPSNQEEGKLTVSQALLEKDGRVWLDDVKTDAGRRTISLPAAAIARPEAAEEASSGREARLWGRVEQ